MLGIRANLRVRRGDVARRRGRRARVARARRAVRRQPVPGADRARAPAGAARRRRGGRDARGGVGAGRGDARAAAAGARGGGARGARLARRRPRADGRDRPPGLRAGGAARRRLGARRARVLALARRRAGRAARRRPGALRALDRRRLAAPRPRTGSASDCPYERAEALSEADDEEARLEALRALRRVRRGARGLAPAPPAARRRRAANPARAARGLTLRAGRPDAARDRGARPDRARGHQRADRPGAGDHAQDGRPPRLRRALEARRLVAARGRCGPGEARRGSRRRLGTPSRSAPASALPRFQSSQKASSAASNSSAAALLGRVGADADRRAVVGLEVLAVVARLLEGRDLEHVALAASATRRGRRRARAGGPPSPTAGRAEAPGGGGGANGPIVRKSAPSMPSGVQLSRRDRAAGAADADQLVGRGLVVRREHHADRGHHDVEGLVLERQVLGVGGHPVELERLRPARALRAGLQQLGREV